MRIFTELEDINKNQTELKNTKTAIKKYTGESQQQTIDDAEEQISELEDRAAKIIQSGQKNI